MDLNDIKTALIATGIPTFHFHAKKCDQYIVWAEEGEGQSIGAGNKKVVQTFEGTIDYYTKTEYDANFDKIQEALNSINVAWRLNSVQHEEDTKYIHYEWVWEML